MERPTILVVSLGTSPPVVTETVWCLFQREPPQAPQEVHLLTTRLGERSVREGRDGVFLCDPDEEGRIEGTRGGRLGELYDAFGHPRPIVHIHVPKSAPEDLRDEGGAFDYADLCVRELAKLRQSRPDARLHVSLAGGRKTMGFFLGYALSLLGRQDDELSHVLVRPADFEATDFWWPGGPPGELVRDGKQLSTADARVELVKVPFVTLAAWVDPSELAPLVRGERDYRHLVRSVDQRLNPVLELSRRGCTATFGDNNTVKLKPSEYALLEVLARAWEEGRSDYGPEGAGGRGWLTWEDFLPNGKAVAPLREVYKVVCQADPHRWEVIRLWDELSGEKPDDKTAREAWMAKEGMLMNKLQNLLSRLRLRLRDLRPVGPYAVHVPTRRIKIGAAGGHRWIYVFGLAGVEDVIIDEGA